MSDDRAAIEELFRTSRPDALHTVLHYLYLPAQGAAAEAAAHLRARGFTTEERLGADGINWLVLARHKIIPSEASIVATRKLMEGFAVALAGEYDGWEAEVV